MEYIDEDGYIYKGAAIDCLNCRYIRNLNTYNSAFTKKCNSNLFSYFCDKHKLCEDEINQTFGSLKSGCTDWKPTD